MKFIINRTGIYLEYYKKPCDDCTESMNFKDCVTGESRVFWTLDINTLEELLAFQEKHGDIILYTLDKGDLSLGYMAFDEETEKILSTFRVLEIYNDHRE